MAKAKTATEVKEDTKINDDDFDGGFSAVEAETDIDDTKQVTVDEPGKEEEVETTTEPEKAAPAKTVETETDDTGKTGTTTQEDTDEDIALLSDEDKTMLSEVEKQFPNFGKVVQRTRSWSGRLKRMHSDLTEARRALATRQAVGEEEEEEQPATTTAAAVKADLSEEDQAALKELSSEYPVVDRAIHAAARQAAREVIEQRIGTVEQRLGSVDETLRGTREADAKDHFDEIAEAHPDFYELSVAPEGNISPLDAWIESLPYREAVQLREVRDSGTARQVINLLTRLKKESPDYRSEPKETTGVNDDAKQKQKAKRETQAAHAEAVRSHSAGPPPSKPDDDDFAGGFGESVRVGQN